EIAPHLEQIYISGGEPMLIEAHFALLEHLVEIGQAPHVKLAYNTNLTVLPERFCKVAPFFKQIELSCSVDGVGAQNEWIRSQSQWVIVLGNLKAACALPKNVEISINCCLSIFNVFYFDEIFRYMKNLSLSLGRELPVFPDILHEPRFMRAELLPLD